MTVCFLLFVYMLPGLLICWQLYRYNGRPANWWKWLALIFAWPFVIAYVRQHKE